VAKRRSLRRAAHRYRELGCFCEMKLKIMHREDDSE